MKRIYYLLFALILFIFGSCENEYYQNHTKDLYFYNELEENINLEIFDDSKISKFELKPNDSVFWTTFTWSSAERKDNVAYVQAPIDAAYENFLYPIDSIKVHYNSKIYTYYNNDYIENSDIVRLLRCDDDLVYFDENKKEQFGWE